MIDDFPALVLEGYGSTTDGTDFLVGGVSVVEKLFEFCSWTPGDALPERGIVEAAPHVQIVVRHVDPPGGE